VSPAHLPTAQHRVPEPWHWTIQQPGHRINRIFKKNSCVSTRSIGDELILVPIKGHLAQLQQIFALNSVGRFIWEKLDGVKNVEQLRAGLIATFDVDEKEAKEDLKTYIQELINHDLILEVTASDL